MKIGRFEINHVCTLCGKKCYVKKSDCDYLNYFLNGFYTILLSTAILLLSSIPGTFKYFYGLEIFIGWIFLFIGFGLMTYSLLKTKKIKNNFDYKDMDNKIGLL